MSPQKKRLLLRGALVGVARAPLEKVGQNEQSSNHRLVVGHSRLQLLFTMWGHRVVAQVFRNSSERKALGLDSVPNNLRTYYAQRAGLSQRLAVHRQLRAQLSPQGLRITLLGQRGRLYPCGPRSRLGIPWSL